MVRLPLGECITRISKGLKGDIIMAIVAVVQGLISVLGYLERWHAVAAWMLCFGYDFLGFLSPFSRSFFSRFLTLVIYSSFPS